MNDYVSGMWNGIKRSRFFFVIAALRWVIALTSIAFGAAYIGYKEHSDISARVDSDFSILAENQRMLLDHLATLLPQLLDQAIEVDLEQELEQTSEYATSVLISLGDFRVPTRRMENARFEYRASLEELIGVTNRIRREGVSGAALDLHNSAQMAANEAGEFLSAVEDFQGGALPQVIGAFF